MACTPESIAKHCGPNAPGIKGKVFLATTDQIASIPDAVDGVVSDPITMNDTQVFEEVHFSKFNGELSAEPEGDADGLMLPWRATGLIPHMAGATSAKLQNMQGGDFIFIVIDRNDKKWIVGDMDEAASFQVGAQTNDKNGYPFTIMWDTGKFCLEYTGDVPT